MSKNKFEERITVSCVGCGRTQSLRKSKLTICDGYTCSLGSCKLNPDYKFPVIPDGYIREIISNAAGSFGGWIIRKATKEELEGLGRARALRDWGINKLADEDKEFYCRCKSKNDESTQR
jgi:hypothetical protein